MVVMKTAEATSILTTTITTDTATAVSGAASRASKTEQPKDASKSVSGAVSGPDKAADSSHTFKSKFSRIRQSVHTHKTDKEDLSAINKPSIPTARRKSLERSANSYSSTSSTATNSSTSTTATAAGSYSRPRSTCSDGSASPLVESLSNVIIEDTSGEPHLDSCKRIEGRQEGDKKIDKSGRYLGGNCEPENTTSVLSGLRSVFQENHKLLEKSKAKQASGPFVESAYQSYSETQDGRQMTRRAAAAASPPPAVGTGNSTSRMNPTVTDMPSIKFIPHQDQRAARPSLAFSPMTRQLPEEGSIIRVGRYSERDLSPNANNGPSSAPIGFKSKVVSRRHCEFWCVNGQWYVKDVKSSSGTFLNHIRLSQPSTESKPFPINDGDIVQLGMDFRGGEESIFRCVKIRIEVNRGWQKKLNDFNTTTHKALRALAKEAGPTSSTECSICLMAISPCQALFVAPCSHVWHYKCIRPVITNPKMYPQFLCPNCRAVADLEADIEDSLDGWDDTEVIDQESGTVNRVVTPVNGATSGDATAEEPSTFAQPQSIAPQARNATTSAQVDTVMGNSNASGSGISTAELESASDILFAETAPITIRDPRSVPETLEGVVTPRNEAGPFVFDGAGRRIQAPTQALA